MKSAFFVGKKPYTIFLLPFCGDLFSVFLWKSAFVSDGGLAPSKQIKTEKKNAKV